MATVKQADIASAFLKELGAPDTAPMRLAVIAWLRMESGSAIIGNNPWNLRPGSDDASFRSGTRTSINGNGTFSVYPDPITGARAAAHRLVAAGHDWRKYDAIVSTARKGDPIGFLNALAASAWDAGRYGTKNGGTNKLITVYKSLGGKAAQDALTGSVSTSGGVTGVSFDQFGLKEGQTITQDDVFRIMATLDKQGVFDAHVPVVGVVLSEQAKNVVLTTLLTFVGKPWNKATRDAIQTAIGQNASEANPANSAGILAPLAPLGDVAAALLDPRKWLLFLALLTGAALAAWGGAHVLSASGGTAQPVAA
jgi:hypothetical protein